MYPTRDGAVWCTHRKGHADDHVGYRKRWRTCAKCVGKGTWTLDKLTRKCPDCKGIGNVLVKKVKPAVEAHDDKGG